MNNLVFERVLITGAAGFIGSHLADRFVSMGSEVLGLDNLLTGNWDNYPDEAETGTIDITDRRLLYTAANMFNPTLVVHCAASYNDPNLWHRDSDTNVGGSINAMLAANHHNAKIVYFNTALPPFTSYAISKIAGGEYIKMGAKNQVTFRLANVYGPRNLSGPIPTFYKRLTSEQPCTISRTKRELVYIDDLVDGVVRIVGNDGHGSIDMCTGRPVTIRTVYDSVCAALNIEVEAEETDPSTDDVAAMNLSPEKASCHDWQAATKIQDGVRAAVEWYDEHGVENTYTHLRMK